MPAFEQSPLPAKAVCLNPKEGEFFTIIGGGVRLLADGSATGGQCTIFEGPIPPGEGPPLHKHTREDEMFYVLEGRFKIRIGERTFIAEPGSFALAPRGTLHAFRNVGSTLGRLYIVCTPAGIEEPFRAVRDPDKGSGKAPLTTEQVGAIFEKHGVTFHGPPLEG